MKYYLISIFWVISFAAYSQSLPTFTNQFDSFNQDQELTKYSYMYFDGGSVYDIRTGKVLIQNAIAGIIKPLNRDTFSIVRKYVGNSYIDTYDKNYKRISSHVVRGQVSPNWKRSVFLQDGDIYTFSIDVLSTDLPTPKKVTDFGSLKTLKIVAWYESKIYILPYKDPMNMYGDLSVYQLDLDSGELVKSELYGYPYEGETWPASLDGRYYSITGDLSSESDKMSAVFDAKTGRYSTNGLYLHTRATGQGLSCFWTKGNLINSIITNDASTETFLRIVDANTSTASNLSLSKVGRFSRIMVLLPGPFAHKSTGSFTAFSYLDLKRTYDGISYDDYHGADHIVYSVPPAESQNENDQLVSKSLVDKKLTRWVNHSITGKINYWPMTWVTRNEIIFTVSDDLATQGTYIHNLSDDSYTRISNYVAQYLHNLPLTGYVIFTVNNKLYKYDHTTRSTTVLRDSGVSIKSVWPMYCEYE